MAEEWSRPEVEAAVDDYLQMLELECRGEHFVKAAHRRGLLARLDGRTAGSVEMKHGNISAVLRDVGYPFIDGYKPYGNYQTLLATVVLERLQLATSLTQLLNEVVTASAEEPSLYEGALAVVSAPEASKLPDRTAREQRLDPDHPTLRRGVDYLAIEAGNRSIGLAGERLVVRHEIHRLRGEGRPKLADRVEHVAQTQGDGLGYDVLSFDASGRERLIEVKTTSFGSRTPFFVSRNEVTVSQRHAEQYYLYRVHAFRRSPTLFTLQGALSERCALEPSQYIARVA